MDCGTVCHNCLGCSQNLKGCSRALYLTFMKQLPSLEKGKSGKDHICDRMQTLLEGMDSAMGRNYSSEKWKTMHKLAFELLVILGNRYKYREPHETLRRAVTEMIQAWHEWGKWMCAYRQFTGAVAALVSYYEGNRTCANCGGPAGLAFHTGLLNVTDHFPNRKWCCCEDCLVTYASTFIYDSYPCSRCRHRRTPR